MKHPAKYSDVLLPVMQKFIDPWALTLDPFAGTGRIHEICKNAIGIELEPEWAGMHKKNLQGDALHLPFRENSFQQVITSPTYGNRMADHHDAKDGSRRMTYRHTLGRALHSQNSGQLQWGQKYRDFHLSAWREVKRVLAPGGIFVLNIGDHFRKNELRPVSAFHAGCIQTLGFKGIDLVRVETPGMRAGQNGQFRVGYEWVLVYEA